MKLYRNVLTVGLFSCVCFQLFAVDRKPFIVVAGLFGVIGTVCYFQHGLYDAACLQLSLTEARDCVIRMGVSLACIGITCSLLTPHDLARIKRSILEKQISKSASAIFFALGTGLNTAFSFMDIRSDCLQRKEITMKHALSFACPLGIGVSIFTALVVDPIFTSSFTPSNLPPNFEIPYGLQFFNLFKKQVGF